MKRLQWEFNKFIQQRYNRSKENQLSSDTKAITLNIKKQYLTFYTVKLANNVGNFSGSLSTLSIT